jgi:hypothetical protein
MIKEPIIIPRWRKKSLMNSLLRQASSKRTTWTAPESSPLPKSTPRSAAFLKANFHSSVSPGRYQICANRCSGHLYFTLKDEQSQIKAVLFKIQQRYLSDSLADGQAVVCRGRISVYEPRGDYQLIVEAVDFHGRRCTAA